MICTLEQGVIEMMTVLLPLARCYVERVPWGGIASVMATAVLTLTYGWLELMAANSVFGVVA